MFIATRRSGACSRRSTGRSWARNFLDERSPIRGVGPITVAPEGQDCGVGRRIMEAVLERGKKAPGIRLLEDAFHMRSLALYAVLGFTVKEPVAVITGSPRGGDASDHEVRPLQDEDLDACGELRRAVDGHECTSELRDAKQAFSVDHSRCDALAGTVGACRAPRCEAVDGPPARWCVLTSVAHADTARTAWARRTDPPADRRRRCMALKAKSMGRSAFRARSATRLLRRSGV